MTREHRFNEGERMQVNMRKLSRALENETNEIFKHDMQSDIIVLHIINNLLENMLNFT